MNAPPPRRRSTHSPPTLVRAAAVLIALAIAAFTLVRDEENLLRDDPESKRLPKMYVCESSAQFCAHSGFKDWVDNQLHGGSEYNFARDGAFWRQLFEPGFEVILVTNEMEATRMRMKASGVDFMYTRWPYTACGYNKLEDFPGTVVLAYGERCADTSLFDLRPRRDYSRTKRLVYLGTNEPSCITERAVRGRVGVIAQFEFPLAFQNVPCFTGRSPDPLPALISNINRARERSAAGALAPSVLHSKRFLVYIQSNCKPHRERVFSAFAAYAKYDPALTPVALGACYGGSEETRALKESSGVASKKNHFEQVINAFSMFQFCLVMENAAVEGYASERLFNALLGGCVPVWWGSNATFHRLLNPDAAVLVDVENPRPAFDRMVALRRDPRMLAEALRAPFATPAQLEQAYSYHDAVGGGRRKRQLQTTLLSTIGVSSPDV